MTDRPDRFARAPWVDFTYVDNLLCGDEDFDALLAASSLGSEQARAIRKQTPGAAREHARRVLERQEKCAPIEEDIDDESANGPTYWLAHEMVSGPKIPGEGM